MSERIEHRIISPGLFRFLCEWLPVINPRDVDTCELCKPYGGDRNISRRNEMYQGTE